MDETDLCRFLVESNKAGYAGGQEKQWVKERDGSTSISYERGDWKSHDNFFGGEPYGGRTIVFFKGDPYWIMVYYGSVEHGMVNSPVYAFLRHALMQMPDDNPFRGPTEYHEGDYRYRNLWSGTTEAFSGKEIIVRGGTPVYHGQYVGGLVDQRKEG